MTGAVAGNAAAFAAAVFFGAAVVATREAVQEVPPLSLAVLRFGQGGLLLLLVLLVGARDLLRFKRRDLPRLALFGTAFYALFPVAFNAGLELTTASRGAVMMATMPAWSALLARAVGRERLIPRQLAGVALSVVGIAGIFFEGGLGFGERASAAAGNALMLFTAACGAFSAVVGKPLLARYPTLSVSCYSMLVGALLLLPLALVEGLPDAVADMDGDTALLVLYLGVVGGALGYYLITFALARLSPTQTSVYINLNPLVATLLAALLLDEPITGAFVAGFAAVFAGLLLVNWPRPTPRPDPVAAIAP